MHAADLGDIGFDLDGHWFSLTDQLQQCLADPASLFRGDRFQILGGKDRGGGNEYCDNKRPLTIIISPSMQSFGHRYKDDSNLFRGQPIHVRQSP